MSASDKRDDLWQRLGAPTPKEKIQQRTQKGVVLDYIDWPFIQERLDSVVPGEWDLTLDTLPLGPETDVDGRNNRERYAVKARLQILGVIRENVGTGHDWKDAATDASKRAAVRFGIGLDLYEKDAPAAEAPAPAPRAAAPAKEFVTCADCRTQYIKGRPCPTCATTAALNPPPANPVAAPDEVNGAEIKCPKCEGQMWDNRQSKKNPKAPDFKCRDRSCDGVIWPPKKPSQPLTTVQELDRAVAGDDADLPF